MALPVETHPIYPLRKASIIISITGIVLCTFSLSLYRGEALIPSCLSLILSCLFCGADLVFYAVKKVKEPDEDPKWPTLRWLIGDAILAAVLQVLFWAAVSMLSWSYYGTNIFGLYGALADFFCSVLHGCAFWKQLKARYKTRWLASLSAQPCARCGYNESTTQLGLNGNRNNTFTYWGPSADFRQTAVLTPESVAGVMEEGLLIGADLAVGYGSTAQAEPVVEQPEEVVVGKGKKKKGQPT